jgi:hypothetical protein
MLGMSIEVKGTTLDQIEELARRAGVRPEAVVRGAVSYLAWAMDQVDLGYEVAAIKRDTPPSITLVDD